jgi:polyhydroxyalkanoate synthesis regulator phasin
MSDQMAEPVEANNQSADTGSSFVKQFKKEFVEANPDLFSGKETNLTEWAQSRLTKLKPLVLPEKPSEADLSAYRAAYGIPDKADGYQFDESLGISAEEAAQVKEMAHKMNLTPAQAKAYAADLVAKGQEHFKLAEQEIEAEKAKTLSKLKETYGEKAPVMLQKAYAVVKRFGGEEFANALNATGLGNHSAMVETMIKIADAISDDTLDVGSSGAKPKTKNFLDKSFPEG